MHGFPRPSVDLGIFSKSRPLDPTEKYWRAPVLHILAEKARYRPRIFFAGDTALKDAIITAGGYDISRPETLPRPLEGSWPWGLRRLVYYAGFHLRGDIKKRTKTPMVLFRYVHKETGVVFSGAEYQTLPKTKAVQNTYQVEWALTEAGVAVAATLHKEFSRDGRNVTNIWLDSQIRDHDLYPRLIKALRWHKTTCRERGSSEIPDHVGHFLATKIKNDSFAKRISLCNPPSFSEIKSYLLRTTYTTFKHWAQDPLHRESRGALTTLECESGPTSAAMVSSEFVWVLQNTSCIRSEGAVSSEVLVDTGAAQRDLHRMDFEHDKHKIHDVFRRFKPGNHERISRIFEYMVDGFNSAEIGNLEGVSANRASTLMANTRDALRDARKTSTDALKVLMYIQENPCSTLQDMEDDLTLSTELSPLVAELVEKDRLEVKDFDLRGRTGTVCGYMVSQIGQRTICEREGILSSLSF